MILINLGLKAVRPEFTKFYFWITVIPFLILFVIFVFLSHAVFIEEKNIRKVIRRSFKIMFTDIKQYSGFLLGDAALAIILIIILIILWLLGLLFGGKAEFILRNIISGMVLIVVIYAIIVFNRMMFYLGILKK